MARQRQTLATKLVQKRLFEQAWNDYASHPVPERPLEGLRDRGSKGEVCLLNLQE